MLLQVYLLWQAQRGDRPGFIPLAPVRQMRWLSRTRDGAVTL